MGLALNGTTQYATSTIPLAWGANGTISFFFKPDWSSGDSVDHFLFSCFSGTHHFSIQKFSDNNWYCGFLEIAGTDYRVVVADSVMSVTSGTLYVLTMEWHTSGGTTFMKLYLDKVLKGTTTPMTFDPTLVAGGTPTFGNGGASFFSSAIGRTCFFTSDIGATKIGQLVDGNDPSTVDASCTNWWKFATGALTVDSVGSATLSLTNSPTFVDLHEPNAGPSAPVIAYAGGTHQVIVGVPFSLSPTTLTGTPAPTVSDGGTLPPGLSVDPVTGDVTGTVDAAAFVSWAGVHDATITATNTEGDDADTPTFEVVYQYLGSDGVTRIVHYPTAGPPISSWGSPWLVTTGTSPTRAPVNIGGGATGAAEVAGAPNTLAQANASINSTTGVISFGVGGANVPGTFVVWLRQSNPVGNGNTYVLTIVVGEQHFGGVAVPFAGPHPPGREFIVNEPRPAGPFSPGGGPGPFG